MKLSDEVRAMQGKVGMMTRANEIADYVDDLEEKLQQAESQLAQQIQAKEKAEKEVLRRVEELHAMVFAHVPYSMNVRIAEFKEALSQQED